MPPGARRNPAGVTPMPASVFWTLRARKHLRECLADELCKEFDRSAESEGGTEGVPGALQRAMDRLKGVLQASFEDDQAVVVEDYFEGFRRKSDLHILLVEVFAASWSRRYVVKIGPAKLLKKEIRGWR